MNRLRCALRGHPLGLSLRSDRDHYRCPCGKRTAVVTDERVVLDNHGNRYIETDRPGTYRRSP